MTTPLIDRMALSATTAAQSAGQHLGRVAGPIAYAAGTFIVATTAGPILALIVGAAAFLITAQSTRGWPTSHRGVMLAVWGVTALWMPLTAVYGAGGVLGYVWPILVLTVGWCHWTGYRYADEALAFAGDLIDRAKGRVRA